VLLETAFVLASLWAAPGEIYRCAKPDGGASYQDRPCAGAPAGRAQDRLSASDDPAALRAWLSRYRQQPPSATPHRQPSIEPAPRLAREPHPDEASTPLSEQQLAICSERFYVCADGDSGRMDRCVAHMAQCAAGGGSACCPSQTLACYRDLRASGSTPAAAVRGALLGPGPSCGP